MVYFFISMNREIFMTYKRYSTVGKVVKKYHKHGNPIEHIHTHVVDNIHVHQPHKHGNPVKLETLLEPYHMLLMEDEVLKERVKKEGIPIRRRAMPPPSFRFKVLMYDKRHFLLIQRPHFNVLLEDKMFPAPPYHLVLWYVFALTFVVFFYFWIIKSLKPLKSLQEEIQKVSKGDLSISLRSNANDEIAQVANEFDNALRTIEALMSSRQLFMRTIMHELKTPIAKGRLVTEMLEDRSFQGKYERVFERLELLIEEFSKIEQMLSSSYELRQSDYNIYDILDQAIELMILDDFEEVIEIEEQGSFVLYTDFNLLALALKNLLDNALKYQSGTKVKVLIGEDAIAIINKGEPLSQQIEHFFQPFHQETNPLNGGLGLGLYIVKSIVERLTLSLTYEYRENHHHFRISQKY